MPAPSEKPASTPGRIGTRRPRSWRAVRAPAAAQLGKKGAIDGNGGKEKTRPLHVSGTRSDTHRLEKCRAINVSYFPYFVHMNWRSTLEPGVRGRRARASPRLVRSMYDETTRSKCSAPRAPSRPGRRRGTPCRIRVRDRWHRTASPARLARPEAVSRPN